MRRLNLRLLLVLMLIARAACAEQLPLPVALGETLADHPLEHPPMSLRTGASAFTNEGIAQVTTNPPTPSLDGGQAGSSDGGDALHRLASTNVDALKSIGASWSTFLHHPIKSLGPLVQTGVQASIQPFTHPKDTIAGLKQYFVQKGPVDGVAQTIYTGCNVASVTCIALGVGSVIGMAMGMPAAAVLGKFALHGLELAGGIGLVSGAAQFLFDEAQSAAPASGSTWPKWVPVLGGKPLFHPTTHQQQVDLVKFDLLNSGGSMLMLGFAKMGEGGGAATYAGLVGSEVGIVAGVTPTDPVAAKVDLSTKYEAVKQAATTGDVPAMQRAQAAYRQAQQTVAQIAR